MRHLRDVIAVAAALGAALSYATASVMQQRAAQDEPADEALKPGLLLRLVRQPLWLGGLAADSLGSRVYDFQLFFERTNRYFDLGDGSPEQKKFLEEVAAPEVSAQV